MSPPVVEFPMVPDAHPLARAQLAAVESIVGREEVLARVYFPRANVQTALFGRGGAAAGAIGAGRHGLFPDASNWAGGLTFTLPVFDLYTLRARRQVEVGNEVMERARYDQTIQTLQADEPQARAQIDFARLVGAISPIELRAAFIARRTGRSLVKR